MTLKVSTGLRNGMLDTGSLKSQLDGGNIKIYSGTEPLTANDAIGSQGTNVLLVTITDDATATGINFDAAAVGDTISKDSQTWRGVVASSGTATFYRHVASADDGASSTTQPRLQGSIAVAGAELNLSSVALTATSSQTISHYSVVLPTL